MSSLRFLTRCKHLRGLVAVRPGAASTCVPAGNAVPRADRGHGQRRTYASEVVTKPKDVALQVQGQKPRTNEPFVKNLFLGRFEKKMLIYPEVLEEEEIAELNHLKETVERFFKEKVDSAAIDREGFIPDETWQGVKELGLFGQQIPVEYGGLGLNATKVARLVEALTQDGAIATSLGAHQSIGLKGILLFGTDEQKAKYLPRLATGEHMAAFCLTEPSSGSDAASIQTKATLSEDGTKFLLNGNKIWITNGGIADIMTVFAKTEVPVPGSPGETQDKVTAFIVERAFGGVTSGKPEDKMGIRGSNTCEVFFDNAPVPIENVIGEVGHGFKVAVTILNTGRFAMGSSMGSFLRNVLAGVTERVSTRTQFGSKLMDFEMIQEKISRIAMHCYVMESMVYMTAGILDSYEQPDASLEAAICKVYSSEHGFESASEALQIMGGLGYMKAYPYERYLRDARITLIYEGTNEILRLFIALTGLQHAGGQLREVLAKMKNPFSDVGYFMQVAKERYYMKRNTSSLELHKELHPVFTDSAGIFELRLVAFQKAVEDSLKLHKDRIVHEQLLLKRIADIVIDLYGMTAVMSRASRSKSIGLKNCDHEVLMANLFVTEAAMRIDKLVEEIRIGKVNNGDEARKKIAKVIFKNGGYAAEHPLTRNW